MTNEKEAIVFIDANNWYHNVKKIIEKPSHIDVLKIAKLICFQYSYNLKEVRWYTSIPSIEDGEIIYYNHMSFLSDLEKRGITVIKRKLQRSSNKEVLEQKNKIIDGLEFCEVCKPLIKETCGSCVGDVKKREKGIDVWIAIDMIRFSLIENSCDCCILVSGDADFIPALELIQSMGKEVLSVSVPKGYSFDLRKTFRSFNLSKNKIMFCLKDYK